MINLNSNDVINILNKNFSYPVIHTEIGSVVAMDPYEAFLYTNVTGSSYLNDITFPFSPKGLMKIFYNAFDYNFVTGIFENLSFRYTPLNISKLYPFVFENKKYILPVEFKSEKELYSKLEKICGSVIASGLRPSDYIIQRIETSKNGNGMEPFMEYLACEYFKRQGYVVESQIPLAHTVGSPDFAGYRTKEQLEFASSSNRLTIGFHIIELAMLKLFDRFSTNVDLPLELNFIVGEAKTSTEIMAAQLSKYMNTGLFTEGYEIHPNKKMPTTDSFGLINIDSNYYINVKKPNIRYDVPFSAYDPEKYSEWLNNYFKFYLLANLTTDELGCFAQNQIGSVINNTSDLVTLVSNSSFATIYKQISEV